MDNYRRLMRFLEDLEGASLHYGLSKHRPNMIMVTVAVPGERWEVEFDLNGDISVEKFISTGHVGNDEELLDFYAVHLTSAHS